MCKAARSSADGEVVTHPACLWHSAHQKRNASDGSDSTALAPRPERLGMQSVVTYLWRIRHRPTDPTLALCLTSTLNEAEGRPRSRRTSQTQRTTPSASSATAPATAKLRLSRSYSLQNRGGSGAASACCGQGLPPPTVRRNVGHTRRHSKLTASFESLNSESS